MEHNKLRFVVTFVPSRAGRLQTFSQREAKLLLEELCEADSSNFDCRPTAHAVVSVVTTKKSKVIPLQARCVPEGG
jgi:hypothetical protein